MGQQSNSQTLKRQWKILQILDPHHFKSTAEIFQAITAQSHDFDVDLRTIQRDLNFLMDLFHLEKAGHSKLALWRWNKSINASTKPISEGDALMLTMVSDYLTPLLPKLFLDPLQPKIAQAKEKLDMIGKAQKAPRLRKKIRIIHPTLNTLPPKLPADIVETLKDALMQEKQIEAHYHSLQSDTQKTLTMHPLGLIMRGPTMYLLATVADYQDPRMFAVHRFRKAVLRDEKTKTPANFDLDSHIQSGATDFGSGKDLRLKIRVYSDIRLNVLTESPLAKDQVMKKKADYTLVEATVPDSWQLKWWLMQHANEIAVEGPAALRKEIIGRLEAALGHYR